MLLEFAIILFQLCNSIAYRIISSSDRALFRSLLQFELISNCELVYVEEKLPSNLTSSCIFLDMIPVFSAFPYGIFTAKVKVGHKEISYRRFEDTHRFTKLCGIGLFVSDVSPPFEKETAQILFDHFTPRYGPLLRKDEDYFIFVFKSVKNVKRILSSEDFGSNIKYKMAYVYDEQLYFNVDLYAKEGKPMIKSMEITAVASGSSDLFPDTTSDFHGKCFKMSVPKVAFRFEMAWDAKKNKFVARRGYYKYWLDEAMNKYNFTYDLFESSFGGSTGTLLHNGSWRGAVADILDRKAEWAFVVGHIVSRDKYLSWSGPVSYEQMVFITHKPQTHVSPKAIFWPFSYLMWALFLLTLLLVPLILKMMIQINGFRRRYEELFEFTLATFLEQGYRGPFDLPMESLKILAVFWLMFAMIVSVAYKGKLTALLVLPVSGWVPQTFEELVNSHYRVGLNVVGKGGAAYSIFASSQGSVYKTLFERMEFYPDAEECLNKASKADFCCIMWQGVADYISAKNLSDRFGHIPLQASSESTSFIADGIVFEKRAIFRSTLDKSIWSAVETGLIPRWFQLDMQFVKSERRQSESKNGKNELHVQPDQGPKKLKLMHFKGAYFILLIGFALSVCKPFLERMPQNRFMMTT